MVAAAQNAKVPVCVHLDHGVTMEMIYRALRIGFTSVMIDASALPYEENLALTKQVVEMAHAMNVSVEAELGRLVTGEAGSKEEDGPALKAEDFYTDPEEAKAFCKETGVDALAIAFGTAHGFYNAQPKLDFDVIKNVAEATGLPLVMHGGSGVSEEGFKKSIANGIRKVNYYSYMSKAGYEAAKAEIESGNSKYLHDVEFAAMKAMKEDVKKAIAVFANLA
jgi:fructose-bisphosphate aldolase class II